VKDKFHVSIPFPESVNVRKILSVEGEKTKEVAFRQTNNIIDIPVDSIRITRQYVNM